MALSDYARALCALTGTLLVPFTGLYLVLGLKRIAGTKPAPARVR